MHRQRIPYGLAFELNCWSLALRESCVESALPVSTMFEKILSSRIELSHVVPM
jgi:hypothetical protein